MAKVILACLPVNVVYLYGIAKRYTKLHNYLCGIDIRLSIMRAEYRGEELLDR